MIRRIIGLFGVVDYVVGYWLLEDSTWDDGGVWKDDKTWDD